MVSFDPVVMAQAREARIAKEAIAEAKDTKIKVALSLFRGGEAFSKLAKNEQEFIDSCERSRRSFRPLSDAQEKWLFDIAAKYQPQPVADEQLESAAEDCASPAP